MTQSKNFWLKESLMKKSFQIHQILFFIKKLFIFRKSCYKKILKRSNLISGYFFLLLTLKWPLEKKTFPFIRFMRYNQLHALNNLYSQSKKDFLFY